MAEFNLTVTPGIKYEGDLPANFQMSPSRSIIYLNTDNLKNGVSYKILIDDFEYDFSTLTYVSTGLDFAGIYKFVDQPLSNSFFIDYSEIASVESFPNSIVFENSSADQYAMQFMNVGLGENADVFSFIFEEQNKTHTIYSPTYLNIWDLVNNLQLPVGGLHDVGNTYQALYYPVDANGLQNSSIMYTWARFDDGVFVDEIQNSSSSLYQIKANDVGYTIKFKVSFTDDAGFEESSDYFGYSSVVGNTPHTATSILLTTGPYTTNKVLTATYVFSDVNGTTASAPVYTWARFDGDTFVADIANGPSNEYTVQSADIGYRIKFKVSFTDDAGFEEKSDYLGFDDVVQNSAPSFNLETQITTYENTSSSAASFFAIDIDGDFLIYTFSTPSKGVIARDNNNGIYVYTPNTDANGTDSFTIEVDDGTTTVTEKIVVTIYNLIEGTIADNPLLGTDRFDKIFGLSGNDAITGGLGDDWLSGGLGNDIFHFASSGDGHDTIYAFEHDVDQIKFDGVSYVVGDPDNYAGITETTNGNGDTVIQYGGGSSSITLTEAVASSPFELVEIPSQRYGDIFTFGMKLKDDPSTTNSDTQIVSEFNDIDIEIGWTSGEFSYWGGYRYGQNDIYDTANSGTGLNLADATLSPGNPNKTTLNLTYYEAGNLAITENDYLATFMLERSDTSSAQTNSITLKTSQGKVLDTASQQLVSLPTSQTPKSYEFVFANDVVDIELSTVRGAAAPNPVMFFTNDHISDGLSLRAIEKLDDLVRYEVVLNISDATFESGEIFSSDHKIKIKNALIFDDSIALKTDILSSEGGELISNSFSTNFLLDDIDITSGVKQLSRYSDQANPFITDRILEFGGEPVVSSNLDNSSALEIHVSNLGLPSSVGTGVNYTGSEGSYALFEFVAYGPSITFQSGRAGNISDVSYGNEIIIARQLDDLGKAHSIVNEEVWSEILNDTAAISVIGDGYYLNSHSYNDVIGADDALGVLRVFIDSVTNSSENQIYGPKNFIAADYNSDGIVSAADAHDILHYTVSGLSAYAVLPQWVYVIGLDDNTSTLNQVQFIEPIGINSFENDDLNITAILKGDLSFSYSSANFSTDMVRDFIPAFETSLIA